MLSFWLAKEDDTNVLELFSDKAVCLSALNGPSFMKKIEDAAKKKPPLTTLMSVKNNASVLIRNTIWNDKAHESLLSITAQVFKVLSYTVKEM